MTKAERLKGLDEKAAKICQYHLDKLNDVSVSCLMSIFFEGRQSIIEEVMPLLKALSLHNAHPMIDANWRYYMDNELKPKLESLIAKLKEEVGL